MCEFPCIVLQMMNGEMNKLNQKANLKNENSSRADPVLGLYILSYYPGWGYLNIKIKATALAGGI